MFDNYPEYLHDVLNAARNMSPARKLRSRKLIAASAASVLVAGGMMFAGNSAIAHAQVREAIASVSADISNQTVQVEVDGSADNSVAYLLSDKPNNLSATDEAAISEQIKTTITADCIANAAGKVKDDETIEVDIFTAENVPVTVTIKKTDSGYAIEKVIAKLDAATADEKKKQVSNAISTSAQKEVNALDLGGFAEQFAEASGLAVDADETTRAAAYDSSMKVLADELVMAVPSGYELQESDMPSAVSASEDASSGEVGSNADKKAQGAGDKPAEKLAADSVKPYSFSYKDGSGSSLSVRAENLGAAFTMMNGPDGANKMMGYWQETANNVAAGASQYLKDETVGFDAKLFYDKQSGMWGYFGHVEFTDGTRDVVYNRVVFVDELADQMITVSYRHDCAADAASAMSLDEFKKLFMHAPQVMQDDVFGSISNTAVRSDDQAAIDAYNAKLREIQILPGQTMTEPEREAAEAAKVAAENAESSGNVEGEAGEASE